MHKHGALGLALAALALPTPAASGADVGLSVHFIPNRAGAHTTILLDLNVHSPVDEPPPAVTGLDLRMPAHMGLATTQLGQANCSATALLDSGPGGCSPNARLGYGNATVIVQIPVVRVVERAPLTVFLGQPTIGHLEVLFFVEGNTPVSAALAIAANLFPDTPPYGDHLQANIPLIPAWPAGPDVALTHLQTTIGPLNLNYRRRVHGHWTTYKPQGITIPTHCPTGGYPFTATLTFNNSTTTTTTTHTPCPRAG